MCQKAFQRRLRSAHRAPREYLVLALPIAFELAHERRRDGGGGNRVREARALPVTGIGSAGETVAVAMAVASNAVVAQAAMPRRRGTPCDAASAAGRLSGRYAGGRAGIDSTHAVGMTAAEFTQWLAATRDTSRPAAGRTDLSVEA